VRALKVILNLKGYLMEKKEAGALQAEEPLLTGEILIKN
jgi:hypothetical protein